MQISAYLMIKCLICVFNHIISENIMSHNKLWSISYIYIYIYIYNNLCIYIYIYIYIFIILYIDTFLSVFLRIWEETSETKMILQWNITKIWNMHMRHEMLLHKLQIEEIEENRTQHSPIQNRHERHTKSVWMGLVVVNLLKYDFNFVRKLKEALKNRRSV